MLAIDAHSAPASSDDAWEQAAFHELHGRSLHGFALIVALGDEDAAARCASASIDAGMARLAELRHPERAAAWLRADVLRRIQRRGGDRPTRSVDAVAALGVDGPVLVALSALSSTQRAALVAADVERLDPRDVAVVVRRSGARVDRLLVAARRRYLAAYLAAAPRDLADGAISQHVATTAHRAMG
jgi:hypothetical protein